MQTWNPCSYRIRLACNTRCGNKRASRTQPVPGVSPTLSLPPGWNTFRWLTTRPRTRVRTRSPISGEMSLPNCCKVVRNRFSLLSCLAPQAGGSCWLARDEEEEEDGPLLKPLGGDGAPFKAVGEWLVPLVTVEGRKIRKKKKTNKARQQENHN